MNKTEIVASVVMTDCVCVETGECTCTKEYISTVGGRILKCECECDCLECVQEYTIEQEE